MLKADLYSEKGTKLEPFSFPREWQEKSQPNLLAQVVRVMEAGIHSGRALVKTRADVNRTKKKLYKQKGTGGARHGARSAPIFVGGGVAHGPTGLQRKLSLPLKMRRKALKMAVSLKVEGGDLVIVKGLSLIKKTSQAMGLIVKIFQNKNPKLTLVLSEANKNASRFFGNIENLDVAMAKNLNAYQVVRGGKIILDKNIFETEKVEKVISKKVIVKERKTK